MKHLLKKDYCVEIKKELEAKIIFDASDLVGIPVHDETRRRKDKSFYKNLRYHVMTSELIVGTTSKPNKDNEDTWLTVAEFIGCIYGVEPERLKQP
jgi:hypothetical protein